MATVNSQVLTIVSGVITLIGSPTGSGYYAVECEGNVDGDEVTTITGGSGHAIITLHPGTLNEYFVLYHNGTSIFLKEQLGFGPQSVQDFITLRDHLGNGSMWVEMERGRFPL
jgi:hypothetical protein